MILRTGNILCLLFVVFSAFGSDSLNSVGNFRYPFSADESVHAIDTGIRQFEISDPSQAFGLHEKHLGNFVQPVYSLFPGSRHNRIGFDNGFRLFDYYLYSAERIPFFDQQRPYSEMSMQIGLDKRLIFKAWHAQRLKRNWSFGTSAERYFNNGFYQRQKSSSSNFEMHTDFSNKAGSYRVLALFTSSNLKSQLNGGLYEDLYMDDLIVQRSTYDTRMLNAAYHINLYQLKVRQELNLMRLRKDSLSNDQKSNVVLGEEFEYSWFRNSFLDQAPDIENYDSLLPLPDTIGMYYKDYRIKNRIYLGLRSPNERAHGRFFAEHDYVKLRHYDSTAKINNLKLGVDAALLIDSFLQTNINLHWIAAGSQLNDLYGKASMTLTRSVFRGVQAQLLYHRFSAARNEEALLTNYVQQIIELKPQQHVEIGMNYKRESWNLKAGLHYHLYKNFVYTDTNRQTIQLQDAYELMEATLRKNIVFGKYLYLDNDVKVCWSPNREVSFPTVSIKHSLYFSKRLFKNAMLGSFGVSLKYHDDFYLPAYDALAQTFYEQRSLKYKSYPQLDVFINAKIKTVRLYLCLNHINQGLLKPKGVYGAYRYPFNERTFSAGISWRFLD